MRASLASLFPSPTFGNLSPLLLILLPLLLPHYYQIFGCTASFLRVPSLHNSFTTRSRRRRIINNNINKCSERLKYILNHHPQPLLLRSLLCCGSSNNNDDDNIAFNNDDDDDDNKKKECNEVPIVVPRPPWQPYTTAYELSIREKEIELLAELRHGDDNIHKHKFRDLWYSERGPDVENEMHAIWKLMGHPQNWNVVEERLLNLIQGNDGEDNYTYIQPFALLSKLYCLQGKFQQSKVLCEQILKIKPYQFMVIETMIANCYAIVSMQEQERQSQQQVDNGDGDSMDYDDDAQEIQQIPNLDDDDDDDDDDHTNSSERISDKNNIHDTLQYWLSKRLPPPSDSTNGGGKRRYEWVECAIQDATRLIQMAKEKNSLPPKRSNLDFYQDDGIILGFEQEQEERSITTTNSSTSGSSRGKKKTNHKSMKAEDDSSTPTNKNSTPPAWQ